MPIRFENSGIIDSEKSAVLKERVNDIAGNVCLPFMISLGGSLHLYRPAANTFVKKKFPELSGRHRELNGMEAIITALIVVSIIHLPWSTD